MSALGCRALALLVAAAGAFGCGSSASDVNASASGGASQGGGASGGTAGVGHGGSAGASGGAQNQGTGGAQNQGTGGAQNQGTGGIGETCLICGGAGFGGGLGHAGSAGASGAGAGGGSACGAATCGPNQYCRAACSGIGGAPPDNPSCADLPAACNGVPSCACICGATASFCTPGAHEVQCGCA